MNYLHYDTIRYSNRREITRCTWGNRQACALQIVYPELGQTKTSSFLLLENESQDFKPGSRNFNITSKKLLSTALCNCSLSDFLSRLKMVFMLFPITPLYKLFILIFKLNRVPVFILPQCIFRLIVWC